MEKDILVIKKMNSNFGGKILNEEGQKALISAVNLILRQLVCQSSRYSKKFLRKKIQVQDLELALRDFNFHEFLDTSVQKESNLDLVKSKAFDDFQKDILDIENEIQNSIRNKMVKKQGNQIYFDWILVKGQLQNQKQIPYQQLAQQQKIHLSYYEQLSRNFKLNEERVIINEYYLQQLNPNIITDQSLDFLKSFQEIIKSLEKEIDQNKIKINLKKFEYRILKSSFHFD